MSRRNSVVNSKMQLSCKSESTYNILALEESKSWKEEAKALRLMIAGSQADMKALETHANALDLLLISVLLN